MKIAVAVAGFHEGNTAEYVLRAFRRLGHSAELLDAPQLYGALRQANFDLYFCVDSGEPFDFAAAALPPAVFSRLAFWLIDYRHNKHRSARRPTDFETARLLNDNGAWIFQAQLEDAEDCRKSGIDRVSWLPIGADAEIWSDQPQEARAFDVAFIGSVWDQGRADALSLIAASGLKLGFFGHRALWKENAARVIRGSALGFNINSFFGEPYAYDVNMRFFETLSCGVPLVTNDIPVLAQLLPRPCPFVRTYRTLAEIVPTLRAALADRDFLASGPAARAWILQHGTYKLRMQSALDKIFS